jgi:uncharacterized OB-fold protein
MITAQEYLKALQENRLLGVKCRACGFVTSPPRLACRQCSSQDTEPVQLSGKGRIVTFTSIFLSAENRSRDPYLVVMVEMDEGPWLLGNIRGVDPTRASIDLIGKRVIMNNLIITKGTPDTAVAPLFILE